MDKEIIDTVAVLRVIGINTTMSCAGHLRRHTGGPYVSFNSPAAVEYETKLGDLEPDFSDVKYRRLYDKTCQLHYREIQKLIEQLDAFYARRTIPYVHRLTILFRGYTGGQLHCQGARLSRVFTPPDRKQLLTRNREEMQEFTEFLKEQNGIQ